MSTTGVGDGEFADNAFSAAHRLKLIMIASVIEGRAISVGGAGTGEARFTVSIAARSRAALPEEPATEADLTTPWALTRNCTRTDAEPLAPGGYCLNRRIWAMTSACHCAGDTALRPAGFADPINAVCCDEAAAGRSAFSDGPDVSVATAFFGALWRCWRTGLAGAAGAGL